MININTFSAFGFPAGLQVLSLSLCVCVCVYWRACFPWAVFAGVVYQWGSTVAPSVLLPPPALRMHYTPIEHSHSG